MFSCFSTIALLHLRQSVNEMRWTNTTQVQGGATFLFEFDNDFGTSSSTYVLSNSATNNLKKLFSFSPLPDAKLAFVQCCPLNMNLQLPIFITVLLTCSYTNTLTINTLTIK